MCLFACICAKENVLGETQGMIPDTQGRLAGAVEQLHDVMVSLKGEGVYVGGHWARWLT